MKIVVYKKATAEYSLEDFVFIDESGASSNMANAYAYSPIGDRAFFPKPVSKGERISVIGAIGYNGLLNAFCFEGTLNSLLFSYYVENFLIKDLSPGKVVIMDNASSHKNTETIELIMGAGAEVLFLPPYCPELNPIEHCWSVVKNFLRKLMPKSKEELYQGWAEGLKLITTDLTKSCFKHCHEMYA